MSTTETKQRRKRRSFSPEYKAETVRQVLEEGKTVPSSRCGGGERGA
jgi:hypothetical protein